MTSTRVKQTSIFTKMLFFFFTFFYLYFFYLFLVLFSRFFFPQMFVLLLYSARISWTSFIDVTHTMTSLKADFHYRTFSPEAKSVSLSFCLEHVNFRLWSNTYSKTKDIKTRFCAFAQKKSPSGNPP